MPIFRVTNKRTGTSTTIRAEDDFHARQEVALRMTKRGNITYGTAWRVVSPSSNYVKVEKIG